MTLSSAFISSPLDASLSRRADALGLRLISDGYGDRIAPGMNARCGDAHWLMLLGWCLASIHRVRPDLMQLSETERYRWLRPLELLWVREGLRSFGEEKGTGAQLPGRRSLADQIDEPLREWPRNFGLSPLAWRRYRQTGPYGAYRILIRSLRGFTTREDGDAGDGWWCGPLARILADDLATNLGFSQPPEASAKRDPEWFWREWWPGRWRNERTPWWRPISSAEHIRALPASTARNHLGKALLDDGDDARIRGHAITCLAKTAPRTFHKALSCLEQRQSTDLSGLTAFSEWSQAVFGVLEDIAKDIKDNDADIGKEGMPVHRIVTRIGRKAQYAGRLARKWLDSAAPAWIPPETMGIGQRLARQMHSARDPSQIVAAILHHHREHGQGAPWLILQKGYVGLASADGTARAARYGFRLSQLTCLAAQLGRLDPDIAACVADSTDTTDEVGDG